MIISIVERCDPQAELNSVIDAEERETWLQANEAAVDFIEQKALENHIADEAMESVLGRVL